MRRSHLLHDSLASGLPAELLVVFHHPVFTVGRQREKTVMMMTCDDVSSCTNLNEVSDFLPVGQ